MHSGYPYVHESHIIDVLSLYWTGCESDIQAVVFIRRQSRQCCRNDSLVCTCNAAILCIIGTVFRSTPCEFVAIFTSWKYNVKTGGVNILLSQY